MARVILRRAVESVEKSTVLRTMLPLFEFAGDLVTDPVAFEDELKANESLSLENMRALSRCARTLPSS